MSSGPPPSDASSSRNTITSENIPLSHGSIFQATMSSPGAPSTSTPYSLQASGHLNPYASLATNLNGSQTKQYNSHPNWKTSEWLMNPLYATYPIPGGAAQAVPTTSHCSQQSYAPYQIHLSGNSTQQSSLSPASNSDPTVHSATSSAITRPSTINVENVSKQRQRSTSPPPLPKFEHWDEVVKQFLKDAGLNQALKGFECDILVMNEDWERNKISHALQRLVINLDSTREMKSRPFSPKGKAKVEEAEVEMEMDRTFDDRKLKYVHLDSVIDEKPRTPTSINKGISAFLARNRARNDASNRSEFLINLSEKRRRAQESGDIDGGQIPSCARVDAKAIDRDAQMKYDIAKNDEGPLKRTRAKKEGTETTIPPTTSQGNAIGAVDEQSLLPKHHPGMNDRLANIETHLAVRYVPSSPKTLWARLKSLEDHIVRLEKDYPPWAALHFNQPNRGWPPPPRATPIIVPAHLRSAEDTEVNKPMPGQASASTSLGLVPIGLKTRNNKSSLHRAVLERLEVQQAMGEKATSDS